MALLTIIPDTNPLLRKTSRKIKYIDGDFREFVSNMYETMVEHSGIGLAAIQVGVAKRMFIYEIPRRRIQKYESCETDEGEMLEDGELKEIPDKAEVIASGDGESAGIEASEEDDDEEEDEEEEEEEEAYAEYTGEYVVCINPKIIEREGSHIDEEGCLSKEGYAAKVERAYSVTFEAYDIEMNKYTKKVEGLEARCVQHELDHLDGILFTDRMVEGTLRDLNAEPEDEEVGLIGAGDGEASLEEETKDKVTASDG
jgi:peptide deformylase